METKLVVQRGVSSKNMQDRLTLALRRRGGKTKHALARLLPLRRRLLLLLLHPLA